jgi:hypothetical protein
MPSQPSLSSGFCPFARQFEALEAEEISMDRREFEARLAEIGPKAKK